MSEIRANTISDAAGTGPIELHKQSAAKAWVNFNGTGTPAIRDSVNVASLTDRGTGLYTLNYTSNMSSADYSSTGSSADNETDATARNRMFTPSTLTASASYANTYTVGGSADNVALVCVSIHGDLA
jgi:hypothetical protein